MAKPAKRLPDWLTVDMTILLVGAGILIAAAVWF
jgi:hypothetical protein